MSKLVEILKFELGLNEFKHLKEEKENKRYIALDLFGRHFLFNLPEILLLADMVAYRLPNNQYKAALAEAAGIAVAEVGKVASHYLIEYTSRLRRSIKRSINEEVDKQI